MNYLNRLQDLKGELSHFKPTLEPKWNKARLWGTPTLFSTPFIIGGLALTILGSLGLLTALSGIKINGLEFIAKHIPASLTVSLVMMRAGLHCINNGVMKARSLARWRQDAKTYLLMAALESDSQRREEYFKKAQEYNYSLPAAYRLDKQLGAHSLYGKLVDDIGAAPHVLSSWEAGWKKFYDYWMDSQVTIGKLDRGVGTLMLIAGLTSVIFLTMGPGVLPSGLNILSNEPYLSVSFTFLLLAYGVDALKRGKRMQKVVKREERRADLELHLEQIVHGIIPTPAKMPSLDVKAMKPGTGTKLWKYSIGCGLIITALGLVYLGLLCFPSKLPNSLSFLTDNTSLSVLYATTLITTGFFTLYSGISMKDRGQKAQWRRLSLQRRAAIFEHLRNPNVSPKMERAEPPRKTFRVKCLNGMALSGTVLGIFLIASAAIGLAIAYGAHVHSSLAFIAADPSFSKFFCVTTALFGIDSIINAQRMNDYFSRREEEYHLVDLLGRIADGHKRRAGPPLLI